MSRLALPLEVADLSAFAKALRRQLSALRQTPGHVELLNLLCQAAGYRNYLHFRSATAAAERLAIPAPLEPVNTDLVEKTARHFDAQGRLLRWPARAKLQTLCLWVLWSRLPAEVTFTEQEVSSLLGDWHVFGDHALLRRALYDGKLVQRTRDGREYRRIEQQPPVELGPLLRRIAPRAE